MVKPIRHLPHVREHPPVSSQLELEGRRPTALEDDFEFIGNKRQARMKARERAHWELGATLSVADLHNGRALAKKWSQQVSSADEVIEAGDCGPGVRSVQEHLTRHGYPVKVDGHFGPKTEAAVKRFRVDHGLPETGVADDETRAILSGPKALRRGARGPEVRRLQERLRAKGQDVAVDGVFGPKTEEAVAAFQKKADLPATGVVYPKTNAAIRAPDEFEPIGFGARGPAVCSLQRDLNRHGFETDVDGVYDGQTAHSVRRFQKSEARPVTGVVDEKTRDALAAPTVAERVEALAKDAEAVERAMAKPEPNLPDRFAELTQSTPEGAEALAEGVSRHARPLPKHDDRSRPGVVGARTAASVSAEETNEVRRGDRGPDVKDIQENLSRHGYALHADGLFGPKTEGAVRRFQTDHGVPATGRVDVETRAILEGPKALRRGDRGKAVEKLQKNLNDKEQRVDVDGIFGPKTEAAVKAFQKQESLPQTGVVYPKTRLALEGPKDFDPFDPMSWRRLGDQDFWEKQWENVKQGVRDAGDFIEDIDTIFTDGIRAFLEKKKDDLGPVKAAISADHTKPIEQLQPGDEYLFDNRGIMRIAGGDLHPLLGAAGVKGAEEVQVKVTRNADGTYTVRQQKLSLRTYSGEVGRSIGKGKGDTTSGTKGTIKGEYGEEQVEALEYTFDDPRDAARAAKLLNEEGWSKYFEDLELSSEERAFLDGHKTAFERGSQDHIRAAVEGKVSVGVLEGRADWNPGRKIRYEYPVRDERGNIVRPGRLIDIDYTLREITAKAGVQVGPKAAKSTTAILPDLYVDVTEERKIYEIDEPPPSDASFADLKERVPARDPKQVVLRRKVWALDDADEALEGQPDRVVTEETLTFENPAQTYYPFREQIRAGDWEDALKLTKAEYRRTVSRPGREAVDVSDLTEDNSDAGTSVRQELSGTLFGLLYYSFRYEGQALLARRRVTEDVARSSG